LDAIIVQQLCHLRSERSSSWSDLDNLVLDIENSLTRFSSDNEVTPIDDSNIRFPHMSSYCDDNMISRLNEISMISNTPVKKDKDNSSLTKDVCILLVYI
jgi:hypothetical protein